MDRVTRVQRRVLTPVGALLGLVVGFFAFQAVIGNRMIEAPKFVLAVFIGGGVAMTIYTLIKDGGGLLLRRRQAAAGAEPTREPTQDALPEEATPKPKRVLKAQRVAKAPAKKAAARERPLRPRDRG